MGFYDSFGYGESEAGAYGSLVVVRDLKKRIEDRLLIHGWNPRTRIRDPYYDMSFLCMYRQTDFSLGRGIFECVGEKVVKDLFELFCIVPYFDRFVGGFPYEVDLLCDRVFPE